MSPEQVKGQSPPASMDIYSLGIACYEHYFGKFQIGVFTMKLHLFLRKSNINFFITSVCFGQ